MIVVDDPESAPGLPAAPLPPQEIDEGEGQEEDGQAQQHAGKKHKSGGWPLCGDAQEAYMRKLRERIDIGQRQAFLEIEGVASSGWIATPPHPYLGAGCGSLPDKELFYLQPVGLWLPDLIFRKMPPCSKCGRNDLVRTSGWAQSPRRVVSLHHPWFIDTRRYSCSGQSCTADLKDKKNGFRFNGTDADSRKHLPLSAQLVFTVLLTHKSAADEKLTKLRPRISPPCLWQRSQTRSPATTTTTSTTSNFRTCKLVEVCCYFLLTNTHLSTFPLIFSSPLSKGGFGRALSPTP